MAKGGARRNVGRRAKRLEQYVAARLTEAGIPSEWVERRNYGTSDTDVRILAAPELKVDCKSMQASAHASLFNKDVRDRYCLRPGDRAVMPFKLKGSQQLLCTIEGDFFIELLATWLKERHCG